jgi:subtilisin inhibitor-like
VIDQRRTALVAATAATLLVGVAAAAHGARQDTPPTLLLPAKPATSFALTVHGVGAERAATLLCNPASGTHPKAAGACAAIDAAGGDFTKLAPLPGQMCPHFVRPVTAAAQGTYRGAPTTYTQTFNNSCEMNRATHSVFDF